MFITNHNSPKILQPGIQSFDFPTAFEPPELALILRLRLHSISLMRRDQFDPDLLKSFVERITIISPITDQSLWFFCDKSRCDSFFHKDDFMRRSTFQVNGDRKTRAVCHCHDLCTFAPLGLSNFPSPFLAATNVPSIIHSLKSNLHRSFKSLASVVSIFSNIPSRCHSWKRLWQVPGDGYRSGKSCQAAPVRNTHKTPFNTSRLFWRDRPFPSSRGSFIGISGSSTPHCSSVSSIGHPHSLSLTYLNLF